MTTNQSNPPAGDDSQTGGEGDGQNGGGGDGSGAGGKSKDHVSYDTHRRLLDEKKRVQAELEQLRQEKQSREQKELEAKGEYQKLLEQERAARAELEAKLKASEEETRDRRKLASVLTAAGGTIDPKFYGLIDYSEVIIDPATGEVDKMSVAKAVDKLKATYPEIIKKAGGPGLPNDTPGAGKGQPGTILYSAWTKLPSKEQKKWNRDQIKDD